LSDLLTGGTSPLVAALAAAYIGGLISAFASTAGVLGASIPLAAPLLDGGVLPVLGTISAIGIASSVVDVSPLSTNGALLVANQRTMDSRVFFRKLLVWSVPVIAVVPLIAWLVFVVLWPWRCPAKPTRVADSGARVVVLGARVADSGARFVNSGARFAGPGARVVPGPQCECPITRNTTSRPRATHPHLQLHPQSRNTGPPGSATPTPAPATRTPGNATRVPDFATRVPEPATRAPGSATRAP